MTRTNRGELARRMVEVLPSYGSWANAFREFETPYGRVGFRQLAILWLIRHAQIPAAELAPKRLAEHYNVQPSVMTRALAKLEAGGFIERQENPRDGRSHRLCITERGRAVSEYVEQLYVEDIVDSLAFLDDGQIDELMSDIDTLDRIVADLKRKQKDRIGRRNEAGKDRSGA